MLISIDVFAQHKEHQMEKSDSDNHSTYVGKTVEYNLHVKDTIVNFTGKNEKALAINGSIPAPTLYFQVGDTAIIHVHNHLQKQQTSTHWHGLLSVSYTHLTLPTMRTV